MGKDVDVIPAHIHVSLWTWAPDILDPVLRLAIYDQVSNIMMVPPAADPL